MRKFVILLFVMGLGLISCESDYQDGIMEETTEQNNSATKSTSAVSDDENIDYFHFKIPEGTKLVEEADKISFELPTGYVAYGFVDGRFVSFTEGTVTCNCTSGKGGCSPGKALGMVGCVMTTCTTCEKSGESVSGGERFSEIGVFNMNEPIAFFSKATDLDGKIMLPAQFYELDIIVEKLAELEKNLLPSDTDKTKIVPISLYGYVVLIEVAENIDNTSPYMAAGSVTCICNTEGSVCPYGSKLIAVYCDASNCQSCTMNTGIYDHFSNKEYSLVSNDYFISVY